MTELAPEALSPMLARLARDLPAGDYLYEPKWDGFRCLAFVARDEVDLRSRHGRPLARYFPELIGAFGRFANVVLDGEIVIVGPSAFDFGALMARLHPAASRVERLARESPARFVAFDLVALGERDLRQTPFEQRRRLLEETMRDAGPTLSLTPITDDPAVAGAWLERFQGAGIDGVVAKGRELGYLPGRRAMVKVKRDRTAECVVGGFRAFEGEPLVASLLLGLYDREGALRHVGVVSSLGDAQRRALFHELRALVTSLQGHPWERGFHLPPSPLGRLRGSAGRWEPDEMRRDWVPVSPVRVCEVAYGQVDGGRFRHPARLRRWRFDRDPKSCTFDQLASVPADLRELIAIP